jgi:hypothetical protein
MEAPIPIDQLRVGQEYKIVCNGRSDRFGRFVRTITTGAGPQVQFNHVSGEQPKTRVAVQGNQCAFYNSTFTQMVGEVANKKKLPNNLMRELLKYGGKSRKASRRRRAKKSRSRKN